MKWTHDRGDATVGRVDLGTALLDPVEREAADICSRRLEVL